MTRLLAITALLGILLAAPAWAQTMADKAHHHHARHGMHHARHHGTATTGDDSAEMLNRQALQGSNSRQ
jgi:hypothetical protein